VVGSEKGEIGKGFREMLRSAKDGAIPVDDRVALAWIFKQRGTASSSVKPASMGISDAGRILSDGVRLSFPIATFKGFDREPPPHERGGHGFLPRTTT
jgi:hypothetical protein